MGNNGTQDMILEYINEYPGSYSSHIREDLELPNSRVKTPLNRLKRNGKIKQAKDGRYYPVDYVDDDLDFEEKMKRDNLSSRQKGNVREHYNDLLTIVKEKLKNCDDRVFTDLVREARLILKEGRF